MPSDLTPANQLCVSVGEQLSASDDISLVVEANAAHMGQCLRCQAEVSSYRRMQRALKSLAAHPVDVHPQLEHQILGALDGVSRVGQRRGSAVAAATLGGLAAAASVIAIASRHRRIVRLAS